MRLKKKSNRAEYLLELAEELQSSGKTEEAKERKSQATTVMKELLRQNSFRDEWLAWQIVVEQSVDDAETKQFIQEMIDIENVSWVYIR